LDARLHIPHEFCLIYDPFDRVSLAQIQDDREAKKWGNAARSDG
jgi:hypothetical protein